MPTPLIEPPLVSPASRWPGAGRGTAALSSGADNLLFVLVYLKTYPLQVVLGQLFGDQYLSRRIIGCIHASPGTALGLG